MIFTEFSHAENAVTLHATDLLGSIRVSRVVFGVPPNKGFPAGRRKLHAGTRALPNPCPDLEAISCAEMVPDALALAFAR